MKGKRKQMLQAAADREIETWPRVGADEASFAATYADCPWPPRRSSKDLCQTSRRWQYKCADRPHTDPKQQPQMIKQAGITDPSKQFLINAINPIFSMLGAIYGSSLLDTLGRRKMLLGGLNR